MSDSGKASYEYEVREVSGVVVIELVGELTSSEGIGPLKEMITERLTENRRLFLMNLTGVDLVNSTGIGLILACVMMVRDAGGQLQVCGVHQRICHVFKVTGVPVIPIHESCKDALSELKGLQRALDRLREKEDEALYEILQNSDEYQPELISGTQGELRRRGLPDKLAEIPEVDWVKVKDPKQLPDEKVGTPHRKRIQRIVETRHREGQGYREILLSLEGVDRAVAAEMLSRRIDNDAWAPNKARHHALTVAWILIALVSVLTSTSVPIGFASSGLYLATVLALIGQNHWGYLFAIFLAGVEILFSLTSMAGQPPHVLFLEGFMITIFAMLGLTALVLRRQFFPYLTVIDARRDEIGKPCILELVEGEV